MNDMRLCHDEMTKQEQQKRGFFYGQSDHSVYRVGLRGVVSAH